MAAAVRTSFCFTDIAGSTQLLSTLGEKAFTDVLERHRQIIRAALEVAGGDEVLTDGDGFFLAFIDAGDALSFAAAAQRALTAEPWPPGAQVRVRMGIHRGPATRRGDRDYVALAVHEAARVSAAAHPGQILVTAAAAEGPVPRGCRLVPLGPYRLRDVAQPLELLSMTGIDLPHGFPPPRAARATSGLPVPRGAIIGRDALLREITTALSTSPSVSLVGPGGVGKTRVALEAAARAAAAYPDGVHLAELSPLSDAGLVAGSVANAVGAPVVPGEEPLDALVTHLGEGRHLVVLDSCERVLDGVADLVDTLARRCPNTVVLATSIEAIRTPDERVVPVRPLDETAAVEMLLDRTATIGAEALPEDADALATIARQLEGMPLALELAVGRIAELGLGPVVEGLGNRFALLTGGLRTASPRHRTLEAAVAWSVDDLEPAEQRLLYGLSVLLGRWSPEAALEIVGDETSTAATGDRAGLDRLLRRSLIVLESDPPRVRLLDTIRHFGAGRLAEQDLREMRGRRLHAMLREVEAAAAQPDALLMPFLDEVAPDLRDAIRSYAGEDLESAARLVSLCMVWFQTRMLWTEALDLVENLLSDLPEGPHRSTLIANSVDLLIQLGRTAEALAQARSVVDDPSAPARARAVSISHLHRLGAPEGTPPLEEALALDIDPQLRLGLRTHVAIARSQTGDHKGAAEDFAEIVADANAIGSTSLALQAEVNRGNALLWSGDLDAAETSLRAAREQALASGGLFQTVGALQGLATIALHRGNPNAAIELAEERIALAQRMGAPRSAAASFGIVGTAALALGDYDRARWAQEQMLTLFRESGTVQGIVVSTFNLAVLSTHVDGELATAAGWALECARAAAGVPAPPLHALGLLSAAGVACLSGDPEGPVLLGAAGMLPGEFSLDPTDREWLSKSEKVALEKLGDDAVAAGRVRGESMALDDALAHAAEVCERLSST